MPLTELSSVKFFPSVSLTPTSQKEIPGSVTLIQGNQLKNHGFRDLNQALEALVPGAYVVHDNFGVPNIGMRGEMGNSRLLYVVNGLESRHVAQRGTNTERDIPLLGDIQHIGVLSGPGGSIRGNGATTGLIDVTTHTGLSFSGTDINLRQGFNEFLSTLEFRHGRRLGDNRGLFIYAGVAWQPGVSRDSAHLFSGQSGMTFDGREVLAGSPVPYQNPHLRENYEDQNKYKFHAQYDDESWSAWIRYVRGGIKNPVDTALPLASASPVPGLSADFPNGIQYFYQQATASLTRKIKLNEATRLELNASYDMLDSAQNAPVSVFTSRSDREDHLVSRNLIRWEPQDSNIKAALGYEFRHNRLGMRSLEKGDRDHQAIMLTSGKVEPWTILNHGIFSEINWKPREDWAVFAGGRVDFHEHSSTSLSPRFAITKDLKHNNSLQVVYSRAVRFLTEDDIRDFRIAYGHVGALPDKVDNLELTYEHHPTDKIHATVTPWLNWRANSEGDHYNNGYRNAGIDATLRYTSDSFNVTLLHSYGTTDRNFASTARVFYRFPDHQSKLILDKKWGNGFQASSSLVVNWSFDRLKHELAKLNITVPDDAYDTSALWNVGLSKQLGRDLYVRLDGHNLLALADDELSRRNFLQPGLFWTEPASMMLTLQKGY
ncbi:TonB-dependent siderophore receptor [Nitrosomonas sp. Nm84]|uniref:TonB-dependent receptor plug domain-containing protein n=1 Tax=Nitrosomonas sp. Nm84 TaxID=200124 RepID=UPI00140472E9|nr:TonB-dependent receptor plug domain-containing protein [Nitrosomonas sp. Nm84]